MAESLGGSRGRNNNGGSLNAMGVSRAAGRTAGGAGGILDRPATARPAGGGIPARTGGMAAVLGGGGYGGSRGRPASAPRERPPADKSMAARARVEDARQVREAQFWGREDKDAIRANRRDLPAFWSVREHGQPFNDERLASGATNLFRLKAPVGLSTGPPDVVATAVGPATKQQAALWKSLETGFKHFASLADLAPLPHGSTANEALTDADREFLLTRLTPYQRIHALHQCLDKDPRTAVKDWMPWPLRILNRDHLAAVEQNRSPVPRPKYDVNDWNGGPAQRDMLVRLAIGELEYMIKRHLKFMSDRACRAARAPSMLEKDILREAFWKVDPRKTGSVSIQQFLQVWQNVLKLMEYEDDWQKGKDLKGRTTRTQVLKPTNLAVVLERNMAAALFVKYGFDKDGLLPYVVFINAVCETPARLLGQETVLKKKERGKNGLEDDLDIAMCLGNAKIEYRYCKQGVFPPAEFSASMGKRSFKPPKAHMWLEHVYGYAGMLEYTRQSNIFYTYNTGKALNPESEKAVKRALLAAQGAQEGASMRAEQLKRVEFVYYTGSVGVVFDKEKFDAGLPCQRFFFGHSNDIQCLTIHPNRKWVATGQQKQTGKEEVPYVCIWDVDHCMQLQRLDHNRDERGVIALCFSGDLLEGKGGDLLLTVTSDDKHSIHVWRWLPHTNKYINAHYIPGWYLGPEKKIRPLRTAQSTDGTGTGDLYFTNEYSIMDDEKLQDAWLGKMPYDLDGWRAACRAGHQGKTGHGDEVNAVQAILEASRQPLVLDRPLWEQRDEWWTQEPHPGPSPGSEVGGCPLWSHLEHPDLRVRADDADGMYMSMRPVKRENGFLQPGTDEEKLRMPHLEQVQNGCNGAPPMVFGVVWNRLRPSSGRKGSEFASYGIKHLKTWIANDDGNFIGTQASFGTGRIENVLSALYVPAMHPMRSPGDSCLLTGFASGKLGLWVPPYPTRAGATYTLVRLIAAHGLGKQITLVDGTQTNGGVRALSLRKAADGAMEVLSGGADGGVKCWRLQDMAGSRSDDIPPKGVNLGKTDTEFTLVLPSVAATRRKEDPPLVVALDCHPALDREFLAGTDGCDIWEVDVDPRIIVEGHEETLDEVAPHAECPYTFATACVSGKCRVWDARRRDVVMSADLGYKLSGIAYSQEHLQILNESQQIVYEGYHLAVSGEKGELTVMRSDTLQPLVHRNDVQSKQGIPELKYSPMGGPKMLAAASADQNVYIYRADRNYQLVSKCVGHSSTVTHVDWSLPVSLPGTPYDGKFMLQSCDAAGDLLFWNPSTGKKLVHNMRDAEWATWTLTVGFDVMGMWPDCSDGTDINAVDRSRLGVPLYDPYEAAFEGSTEAAMHYSERDSADGISGAGFLVTADDFSLIKLFNFPVVADDAPYKAFRGHASHVTSVRFLADDRLVVSVGGFDRGIYQWRTCGIATGLPPLPVVYHMLGDCEKKAPDADAAKSMRAGVLERLCARSRAFRSYERLKLYAMRVAIEEKRSNSAASAKPQPKLPDQMVWAKVPGTTNQYGPVPRSMLGSEGGGGGGTAGRGGGTTPRAAAATPPRGNSAGPSPRASVTPSPRGSVQGSVVGSVRGSAAPSPRGSMRGSAGGAAAAAASPPPPQLPPPAAAAAASRPPSVQSIGRGSVGRGSAAAAATPSMDGSEVVMDGSEDLAVSGEVGSYEPSGVPSPHGTAVERNLGTSGSRRGSATGSAMGASSLQLGRGMGGGGSLADTPQLMTPRSAVGGGWGAGGGDGDGDGSVAGGPTGGRGVGNEGGRSGRRYVTSDSVPEEESEVPDEEDLPGRRDADVDEDEF